MSEISKTYEPQAIEEKWYADWLAKGCFTADPARVSATRPAYSIVIPPPNVTGVLTLGHVLNNTIQDILARRARMLGKEVLWLPGTDHAGIATQNVVEKSLRKTGQMKHRDDLGRDDLVEKIWEWKEEYGGKILQQLRALGASCDWSRTRFTMDPEYSRCVQRVFVDLYKKGLIYRGKRMVNWCPSALTALSDEEVIMKPTNGLLYYFKVEVVVATPPSPTLPVMPKMASAPSVFAEPDRTEKGSEREEDVADTAATSASIWLTIATTRPETIPGDTALAVNPKDERYAHLIGQQVRRPLPLENQALIPIVGDEHVDFDFGTGVLKVTPAHDKADFEIGQRHGLASIEVIDAKGTMNDLAGVDLAGLDRFEARKKAAEMLREAGVLEKEEPHQNNVGYSERADVPIEPRLSEQWFLKYPSVEQARGCVEQAGASSTKTVQIVPLSEPMPGGGDRAKSRLAALEMVRRQGWIGMTFLNEDTGWPILLRRKSLSHAFNNRSAIVIQAVAVLPELIRTAVLISSEDHQPPHPRYRRVHHFLAALELEGKLHSIPITVKELADGRMLYDFKAKKWMPGGKPLGAHPLAGKLGLQPAPSIRLKVADLLGDVNPLEPQIRFFPDRWAKVYEHWLGGIQDWCISRQLWWGHRVPVWRKRVVATEGMKKMQQAQTLMFEALREQYGDTIPQTYAPLVERSHSEEPGHISYCSHHFVSGEIIDLEAVTFSEKEAKFLEDEGFAQDSDVLDTWFSSWLWPFATMGWPEKTDTLAKFYPTTDLVTGPDIIFFWVARMIMAGFEWMGGMPFKNVYFTGIIRDKQGRKMSKSLGNSPDPLDLIAKYGADALRFGVMRSAPLGQDILFDEKNVELGRNFCTKLWNAARFRQMHSSGDVSSPEVPAASPPQFEAEIIPTLLTNDDQWILLRLDAAIREVSTALGEYRFSDAANALYRFFWTEYCDWYLEAAKAALGSARAPRAVFGAPAKDTFTAYSLVSKDPSGEARALHDNTLAVMDFVLGHTLRLFHPFLPFITEELWHGMGFREDLPADQGGETIMFARWPLPFDADFQEHYGLLPANEAAAVAKYDTVNAGRALRATYHLASNKRIRFVLQPHATLTAHDAEVLKILLNAEPLDLLTVGENYAAPKGTPVSITPLGTLFLPLEGLIDVTAERERLTKEIGKVTDELAKVRAKLANPGFTDKVPAAVLEEHRQRETNWAEKLGQLQKMQEALG